MNKGLNKEQDPDHPSDGLCCYHSETEPLRNILVSLSEVNLQIVLINYDNINEVLFF
jgi:hypothetical protein